VDGFSYNLDYMKQNIRSEAARRRRMDKPVERQASKSLETVQL
jgi:hypothetical protein